MYCHQADSKLSIMNYALFKKNIHKMENTSVINKKVYEQPAIVVVELPEKPSLLYASLPIVDDEEGA